MRKARMTSLILCGALMTLVGSFAWAKVTAFDAKTLKWTWTVNGDEDNGGSSTITMKEETISKGVTGYSFAGAITNKYEYGFVNVKLTPDDATLDKLKTATGLSFKIVGDGDDYAVKIITSDVKDYAYYEYRFPTVKGQPITVVVPVGFLMQPSWGKAVGASVNTQLAQLIEFQTTRNGSPGPFEFKLYDFKLYTGGVPELTSTEKKDNDKAVKAAAAAEAKIVKPVGGALTDVVWNVGDNFQYANGYSIYFIDPRVFNGNKVSKGETYTLKFTCTASRDLEAEMEIFLVDHTEAAGWHTELCPRVIPPGSKLKAGVPFSAEITFATTGNAKSAKVDANCIGMETEGAGKKGVKGSGVQKPFTLTFSEFVFTKGGAATSGTTGSSSDGTAVASSAATKASEPKFGAPTAFQKTLNDSLNKVPINVAGKQVSISLEGDYWRGKVNGSDLLAGTCKINESANGDATITLDQSFLYVDTGKKVPLKGTPIGSWVATPGPEINLDYKKSSGAVSLK